MVTHAGRIEPAGYHSDRLPPRRLFGFWSSSLVGAAVPNSRLKRFQVWIERGMLLLMVDVPFRESQRLIDLVAPHGHPEAVPGGTEPTIAAFP